MTEDAAGTGFFKTDEGLLHVGRIAGLFYVVAVLVGCGWIDEFDRLCAARLASAAAWWLTFGGKRVPRTVADLIAHPVRTVGTVLFVLAVTSQFYFVWTRHHPHL